MLAPQVFNFKLKHTHQTYSKCPLNSAVLDDIVKKHSFNHSVCIFFPDTLNLPPDISDCLKNDTEYYKISKLPIYDFIDYTFIEAFIQRGQLTALSIDTLLDLDNCAAITPNGILVISLHKNLFYELGIDKGPAVDLIKQKTEDKIQLHINMKEACFKPGKNNYERVLGQLKKTNQLTMDFILSWEPGDDEICPSSVAMYFHKKGYLVEECLNIKNSRVDYNIKIPNSGTDPEEMFEWLGLHALAFKKYSDPVIQEFLSSYTGTDSMKDVGQGVFVQWTGFFSVYKVQKLIEILRSYIIERKSIPFIGMHVQGFDDAPVTWALSTNNFLTSGDNNYSFILFPNETVFVMKNLV